MSDGKAKFKAGERKRCPNLVTIKDSQPTVSQYTNWLFKVPPLLRKTKGFFIRYQKPRKNSRKMKNNSKLLNREQTKNDMKRGMWENNWCQIYCSLVFKEKIVALSQRKKRHYAAKRYNRDQKNIFFDKIYLLLKRKAK